MCQLFALNSLAPAAITFAFTGFSARGGATAEHADGFGIAFHEGTACRRFVDPAPACNSVLAQFLRTNPIHARTALAHIRKATQGPVQLSNCHPFVREWHGREWSFAHNGDLKGYHPRPDGHFRPVGETDSERAFCWMLGRLRRRFARALPEVAQLAPAIAELAEAIAPHGRFNFLLSDGRALYAYGATRLFWLQRRHPFGTAHLVDHDLELDLATTNGPDDRMVLVATEPLTRNECWQPFAPGELRVFADGEPVWQRLPAAAAAPATYAPMSTQAQLA